MKALKVIPEIFIWLIFAVITGFGYAFSFFGYLESHMQLSVFNIVIPTFVWLLLAVISTLLLKAAQNVRYEINFSKAESVFLESSVFVLFMIGGWIFRFVDYFHAAWPSETDQTYFMYAMVAKDVDLYMNPHPISRIYVAFLHSILRVFGNQYTVGAYAQFILLLIGVLLWYLAIRKVSGKITAQFFVAGAMLLPDSIKASMQCDPMMLLFVFYGIIAWLLIKYVHSKEIGFIQYIMLFLSSMLVILALTFDISGILVVLAYLVVLRNKDRREEKAGIRHKGTACVELLGMLTGGILFRYVQSVIYDMHFAVSGGFNCFEGLKLFLPDLSDVKEFVFQLGAHPVFIVSIAVISVYWFLINKRATTWIMFALILLFAIQFLGLDYYLKHDFMIYIGIVLLLGIAAGQLLEKEMLVMDGSEVLTENLLIQKAEEPVVQVINFDEEPAVTVEEKLIPEEKAPVSEEEDGNTLITEKPLIYIPKSMEIPKRISKPKIDFALEVEESKLHYDVAVEENSDFDIP